MLPVKHTVIYTFFAITSVQNTCFCSVFNALASKNTAKSCYVPCFFSFLAVFPLPESYQNDPKFHFNIPSCAQTHKNPRKMSKTPPNSGLGAKPFLPPPAKADIATAILTNVIEHLVLLLPPNKHAFTAKAVWADLRGYDIWCIPHLLCTSELYIRLLQISRNVPLFHSGHTPIASMKPASVNRLSGAIAKACGKVHQYPQRFAGPPQTRWSITGSVLSTIW